METLLALYNAFIEGMGEPPAAIHAGREAFELLQLSGVIDADGRVIRKGYEHLPKVIRHGWLENDCLVAIGEPPKIF